MEITTREELLIALVDACELEHGLLSQYVFAAFSLKQVADEGLSWSMCEKARGWKKTLLAIAREEMAHLGTVCNLLTAIGGAPHFRLPSFPRRPKYYPLDIPFMLAPFSTDSLARFVRFERPADTMAHALVEGVAPEIPNYHRVGELYAAIEKAFATIDGLLIGPKSNQDRDDWSRSLKIFPVIDRASAIAAVKFIITQGEGLVAGDPNSHYAKFKAILAELNAIIAADPNVKFAREVALNPRTREHRDSDGEDVTLLTDPFTLSIAELFNGSYETMLLMLQQYYSFGSETDSQRDGWRQATREMMSCAVRPLGELLTTMPAGKGSLRAGAPFETYGDIQVSPHTESAWAVICERLAFYSAKAQELHAERPDLPRLRLVSENLYTISSNLRSALGDVSPARARTLAERADSRYGASRHGQEE